MHAADSAGGVTRSPHPTGNCHTVTGPSRSTGGRRTGPSAATPNGHTAADAGPTTTSGGGGHHVEVCRWLADAAPCYGGAHSSGPLPGGRQRLHNLGLLGRLGEALEAGLLPLKVLVEAVGPVAHRSGKRRGGFRLWSEIELLKTHKKLY